MEKLVMLSLAVILTASCKGQEHKNEENIQEDNQKQITEQPKGTWKVDKEFDEDGNLIRYDSIYSWSSSDYLGELAQKNPDSLLQSFRSKFYRNFKGFDDRGFGDFFTEDSLFTKRFFDKDFFDSQFGEDFMDIDRIRERMETMQQNFMERYRSEFDSLQRRDTPDNE
ncbi:hypothetical protein RQM65_12015 [Pricia sp. S334]|uniref:Lipoprotein n=1 Tax=Pricia mediterranea TaxID=3076079 RepID=A0ABU3L6V6_9FLAO|nr:hypothetical protein [Pricia sp. S334]MDT7829395.1 hypothetical protein [Pricia sp. S334]